MSIAIVGAGLGGPVLARTLHRHGVPAAVYEAEVSPETRGQGGLLDIEAYTGQLALRGAPVSTTPFVQSSALPRMRNAL